MTDPMIENLAKDEWFRSDIAEIDAKAWYEQALANSVRADQDCEIVIRRKCMEANELKAFFSAVRKDIPKVCVMETLWTRLNGKACMVEACPYNGVCEAMMGMSDSLIDRVCNDPDVQAYCDNDVSATEKLYAAVTREEFEELRTSVSKLRQDLATLDRRTLPARRYAARHEKKYG